MGDFQTVGNSGGSESSRIIEFQNRRKVTIFQGFVKIAGNRLATLDLTREKQTADNAINKVKTTGNAKYNPI